MNDCLIDPNLSNSNFCEIASDDGSGSVDLIEDSYKIKTCG